MKNNKVFVGLSGGVDSAVSAALLKKEGYDVTGVFIKAWTPFDEAQGKPLSPCTWKEDRRSAMRVCAILDIPFLTLDLEKEYKKEVVDYMIAEYKAGRTPNPDVICNKEIKFGHFLKFALDSGADFVATGHYAKTSPPTPLLAKEKGGGEKHKIINSIETAVFPLLSRGEGDTPARLGRSSEKCVVRLLEGADKNKDQSYFLWTLTQKQLRHILFPIGHLQKEEVRKLAQKFKLPQATRKDSQGLCFLGKVDMKEFLKEYLGAKKGDVLFENGGKIGEHDGSLLYTIGERHGFSINNKSTKSEPFYVVAKDVEKNTITVTPKSSPPARATTKSELAETPLSLTRRGGLGGEVLLQNINWISEIIFDQKNIYSCRIRYRQQKVGCTITPQSLNQQGSSLLVKFDESQAGIAPGQSLVLYDGEICLGGGIIKI